MIFIDNYERYKYTKVEVPITLNKCLSDHENSEYYIDIECNSFSQNQCYIGMQFIEKILIKRIYTEKNSLDFVEPQWLITLIIPQAKTEDEVIQILTDFCETLSFNCAKKHKYFQYCGFYGFSFETTKIKRSYASENLIFSEVDNNYHIGAIEMKTRSPMQNNIFELPTAKSTETLLLQELRNAFLTALRSKDSISRYILLYYLFEIMYATPEYQELVSMHTEKEKNVKRSKILFQYLQSLGFKDYFSFGEKFELNTEILYKIIITRNDLTHRADTSKVSDLMYHHLIPILQQLFSLLK